MELKGKRQKYPPEIKLEAIRLHTEEGLSNEIIRERLGITDVSRIVTWVREFTNGRRDYSTNTPKTHRTYSAEIKLEAVRLHEEIGLTYEEIVNKLGISEKSILKRWVRRYRQGEREFLETRGRNSKGRPKKAQYNTEEKFKSRQQMEAKIKRLEMENALLKKVWGVLRR